MPTWRLHLRVSANEDGTGDDAFYTTEHTYPSLRKAKTAAKLYEKAHKKGKAPWLREVRVYQERETLQEKEDDNGKSNPRTK
jgi:hypothetical protein